MQHFLFDRYIPGLKARAYKSLFERYQNTYSDISTTVKYYAKHDPEVVRDLKRKAAAGTIKKSYGKSYGSPA